MLDVLTFLVTTLAFVAAGIYAGISYKMWREMQTQTTTSQKQLEATDRPWLKVDFSADARGFYFRPNGDAELTLKLQIKNIGHSVATGVIIPHDMLLVTDKNFPQGPVELQKKACDAVSKNPISSKEDEFQQEAQMAMTVFPGDTNNSRDVGFVISKSAIDSAEELGPMGHQPSYVPGGKRINPVIVGCVDYQFGTSQRHHQTGFIYTVGRLDRKDIGKSFPIHLIEIGRTVPGPDVYLTQYGFGGTGAN